MKLTGLHLLLTYQCTLECSHCFVWGSPWQRGVMSLEDIRMILDQAEDLGMVRSIYFEGGEPFLYYAILLKAVQEAASRGFQVGIVTNAYWANHAGDALEALKPFAGLVQDLSVSSDLYHSDELLSIQARNASKAAEAYKISSGIITIARPEVEAQTSSGQLSHGEGAVMYRGRASTELAGQAPHQPWDQLTACPHEDLAEPGRVHLDPMGYVHVCQGICAGNFFQHTLAEICRHDQPQAHPIRGPLLRGGPAELVREYDLPHADSYADACHLCYESRRLLRERFPEELAPDPMYGV